MTTLTDAAKPLSHWESIPLAILSSVGLIACGVAQLLPDGTASLILESAGNASILVGVFATVMGTRAWIRNPASQTFRPSASRGWIFGGVIILLVIHFLTGTTENERIAAVAGIISAVALIAIGVVNSVTVVLDNRAQKRHLASLTLTGEAVQ